MLRQCWVRIENRGASRPCVSYRTSAPSGPQRPPYRILRGMHLLRVGRCDMRELKWRHGKVCRNCQRAMERQNKGDIRRQLTRVRIGVGWIRPVLDIELVNPLTRSVLEFIRRCVTEARFPRILPWSHRRRDQVEWHEIADHGRQNSVRRAHELVTTKWNATVLPRKPFSIGAARMSSANGNGIRWNPGGSRQPLSSTFSSCNKRAVSAASHEAEHARGP